MGPVAVTTPILLLHTSSFNLTNQISTMMKFVLLSVFLSCLLLTDVEGYYWPQPQQQNSMSQWLPYLLMQQGGSGNNNLMLWMMMMGGMGGGMGGNSMLPYIPMNQGGAGGGLNNNNLALAMMGGQPGMQNPWMTYYMLNKHQHPAYAAEGHTH